MEASVTVGGEEHRHLARVLRVRPGDSVTLFDGLGGEVDARVQRVGRDETELSLGARRESTVSPADAPLTLLTAVPRGGRMDFLVQKATELGVHRVVPVIAARSVARPEAGRRSRWQKIAQEAARQSGRADVPQIDAPVALAAAVSAADLPGRRFAFFEGERQRSLGAALDDDSSLEATAVLIGPEGGFDPAEIGAARDAGFVTLGLGPLILRVETAAIVALALIQDRYGRLK
jgi:16S rRNA (uracil1498-N3)-methyltransferase